MGNFAVDDENISLEHFKQATPTAFYKALQIAKTKNEFSAFVTLHEEEDYKNCKALFLMVDDTAGIAVEKDGNIISVFSDKTHRGVLKFLIPLAIEIGGEKLDCFGSTKLTALYHQRGFIPICKTKFVKEFAPADWNFKRDGEPDIIFWVFDKTKQNLFEDSVGKVDLDNIPLLDSYDYAKNFRDMYLKLMH